MDSNNPPNFYDPVSPATNSEPLDTLIMNDMDPTFGLEYLNEHIFITEENFQSIEQIDISNEGGVETQNNNIYNIDKYNPMSVMFSPEDISTVEDSFLTNDFLNLLGNTTENVSHIEAANDSLQESTQYIGDETSSFKTKWQFNDIMFNIDDTEGKSIVISNNIGNDTINQYIPLHNGGSNKVKVNYNVKDVPDIISSTKPKQPLRLDIIQQENMHSLNTPEVIQSVISLDDDNELDLIKLITDDSIILDGSIIAEEIKTISPTTKRKQQSCDEVIISPKRARSQNLSDDDVIKFFDYPTPTQAVPIKEEDVTMLFDLDDSNADTCGSIASSSSSSQSSVTTRPRRGRPPKNPLTVKIELACPSGNDKDSKYRELRNKNNEASRRSRQNRKEREISKEREANLLEERNKDLLNKVAKLEAELAVYKDRLMKGALSK